MDKNDALAIANAAIQIGIECSQPKSVKQQTQLSLETSRQFLTRSIVSLGSHIRVIILEYVISYPKGEQGRPSGNGDILAV